MNVSHLQAFQTVARLGSLAAAARALSLDPSAVSRSIAVLERELGVRLIERTTRRQNLTQAGQIYLECLEPVLDGLIEARDAAVELVHEPRGRLRVTASSAFGQIAIGPLVKPFAAAYPAVTLDLLLTDTLVDLIDEKIDVAFRLGPQPTGDLIIARLRTTAKRLVASPDYLASGPPIATPRDIGNHHRLVSPLPGRRSAWLFGRGEERVTVAAEGRLSTSNTVVLRDCVLAGMGLAVLADWLIDEHVATGRLKVLLPEWTAAAGDAAGDSDSAVWIVYPSRRFLPLKTRMFIDHARNVLSENWSTVPAHF